MTTSDLPVNRSSVDAAIEQLQTTGRLPAAWWAMPQVRDALYLLAEQFSNSDMVPTDYRGKPGNCLIAFSAGMAIGIASPLACLQSVAVINGRPMLWGDAVPAVVMAHPSCLETSDECTGTIEDEDRCWTFTIRRRLAAGGTRTVSRSFSVADAKRARLWMRTGREGAPTPWVTAPDRMLLNRARMFACRDAFADVLQGIHYGDLDDEVMQAADFKILDAKAATGSAPAAAADPGVVVTEDGFDAPGPKLRQSKHTKSRPKAPKVGDSCSGPNGVEVWMPDNRWANWRALTLADTERLASAVNPHPELREIIDLLAKASAAAETKAPTEPAATTAPEAAAASNEGAKVDADPAAPAALEGRTQAAADEPNPFLPDWAEADVLQGKLCDIEVAGKAQACYLQTKSFVRGGIPKGQQGDVLVRLLTGNRQHTMLIWDRGAWTEHGPSEPYERAARAALGRAITTQAQRLKLTPQAVLERAEGEPKCEAETWSTWQDMPTRIMILVYALLLRGGAK